MTAHGSHTRPLLDVSRLVAAAGVIALTLATPGGRAAVRAQDAPGGAPAATLSGSANYQDLRRIVPISGDARAGEKQAALCAACHGAQGISPVPTFPNLAGQRADYMYWEMVGYKRGTRPESPMTPIVSTLDDRAMRDLAVYYAEMKPAAPQPAAAADPQQVRRGEQLFAAGDPVRGIPACSGCHGPDARGHPDAGQADSSGHTPYLVYPALRGQQTQYLQTRLAQFRAGTLRDSTTDFVMNGVGQTIDDDTIQVVSAWLASLAP